MTPREIKAWQDHCEREYRLEDRVWFPWVAVGALVLAFYAGFVVCGLWLVK